MIVQLVESEDMYSAAFEQTGYGIPRYRGSPMMGGSFWGRMIGLAKGLFSKAAPHLSNLVTQAQPHVKRLAGQALDTAIDGAVSRVTEKLTKKSQGGGQKKRTRTKNPSLKHTKVKSLKK